MADKYDPIADLAELVVAVLGYNTTDPAHYAGRVTMRLRISEDESVQAVAAALRKALGLGTRAVTYDMADWDTYTVLTLALEELAASQRERARDGRRGAMRQRERAVLADEMRRRAVAAWEARGE